MRRIAPRGEAHALLRAVRSLNYQLRSGAAVDGEVELVLHGSEEGLRGGRIHAIVHRGRVDIGDLLVEATLAGAYLADLRKKGVVEFLAQEGSVLLPILIQHIAANGEVAQHTRCPLAELGRAD